MSAIAIEFQIEPEGADPILYEIIGTAYSAVADTRDEPGNEAYAEIEEIRLDGNEIPSKDWESHGFTKEIQKKVEEDLLAVACDAGESAYEDEMDHRIDERRGN